MIVPMRGLVKWQYESERGKRQLVLMWNRGRRKKNRDLMIPWVEARESIDGVVHGVLLVPGSQDLPGTGMSQNVTCVVSHEAEAKSARRGMALR